MKTNTLALIPSLVLLFAGACEKSESPATQNEAEMRLDITYDAGNIHSTDMPFEMMLTIEERYATADHCFLIVSNSLGKIDVTLGEQHISQNQRTKIFYSVCNETESTRTLIFKVTPRAFAVADPIFRIDFTVITADGCTTASRSAEVCVLNSSPIDVQAEYNRDPISSIQMLNIDFTIAKAGFTGDYVLEFRNTSGSGYCIYGQEFQSGERIAVHSEQTPLTIEYQPTSIGRHEIVFRISDEACSQEVAVICEVFGPESLAVPTKSGAYIHTRNYTGNTYYTAQEWEFMDTSGLEVAGIAFIWGSTRILLPLHALGPLPFCSSDDDLLAIADIKKEEADNGKSNTRKLHEAYRSGLLEAAPIVEACYNYNPEYPGQWYLPDYRTLQDLSGTWCCPTIRKCLESVGGTLFPDTRTFATSSIYESTYIHRYEFLPSAASLYYGRSGVNKSTDPLYFFPIRDL